jgi:hypothetical protein
LGVIAAGRGSYQQEDGLEGYARDGFDATKDMVQAGSSQASREDEACRTQSGLADRYDQFFFVGFYAVVFDNGDRLLEPKDCRLDAGQTLQGRRVGWCIKDGIGI